MERPFKGVEQAYQAAKFEDPEKIRRIQECSFPAQAKILARKWPVEHLDWENFKFRVMWDLSVQKWTQEPHKRQLLQLPTDIVEFVNWRDFVWGVVITTAGRVLGGNDGLGRILTEIKNQLTQSPGTRPLWRESFQIQAAESQRPLL
jgi:predicted NAD-dependent protein-ADP-ribosyltransferase YbiA (DUF1768 family)